MKINGRHFVDEEVELDGNDFEGCTFQNCRIKFTARTPFTMNRCSFDNIKWVFGGPAAATFSLLTRLVETNPDYGRSVLVSAFPQLLEWLSDEAKERLLPDEPADE